MILQLKKTQLMKTILEKKVIPVKSVHYDET